MKKMLVVLLLAAFGSASFGDSLYRTQINGGDWEYWDTIADAVANSVSKKDTTIETVVIELLGDDTTTWTGDVLWGRASSSGGYSTRSCTFRSSTEGGNLTRYMLKKAAAGAQFSGNMPTGTVTINLENIIIDGGAEWTSPDDLADLGDEGLGGQAIGLIKSSTGTALNNNIWNFSDGCLLRNFHLNGSSCAVIYANYTSQAIYTFSAGSRVEDCRGGPVIYGMRHTPGFVLDGTVIVRCASPGAIVQLENNNASGGDMAAGVKVIRNSIITNNYMSGNAGAAVVFKKAFTLTVGGGLKICDNVNSTGVAVDLKLDSTSLLLVSGGLTETAKVGLVTSARPEIGSAFAATDNAEATRADAFFWDESTEEDYLVGANGSDGQIVWAKGVVPKIVYEAFGWDGYADGATHGIGVKVISPEAAVVYYSMNGSPWSTEQPQLVSPGQYAVDFKIQASGCQSVSGQKTVVIYDESYVPVMKCRTRVNGGDWTGWPDFVTACSVVSQQNYVAGDWTVDIELMCNQAINGIVPIGYVKSGSTQHWGNRIVNIRTRSDNGQRYTLLRENDAAKLHLNLHSASAVYAFSNIVLDGGAKWTGKDDFTDLANDGVGLSGDFFTRNNYSQWVVMEDGAVLRNFDLSAGCLMKETNANYNHKFRMEPGSLLADCRGGSLIRWERWTHHIELMGGMVTRCFAGGKDLFYVAGTAATMSYAEGNHEIGGDFTMTNNVLGTAGWASYCDKISHFKLSGSPTVRDNLRADGTQANVYVDSTVNLTLETAMSAKKAWVGLYVNGATQKGMVFGKVGEDWVSPSTGPEANALHCDRVGRSLVGWVNLDSRDLYWGSRPSGLLLMVR